MQSWVVWGITVQYEAVQFRAIRHSLGQSEAVSGSLGQSGIVGHIWASLVQSGLVQGGPGLFGALQCGLVVSSPG